MNRIKSFIMIIFFLAGINSRAYLQDNVSADLTGKTIISTVDKLRVRDSTGLDSKITGHLIAGETALVEQRSAVKTKVKDRENYWYRIKSSTVSGWVYGGLITDVFTESADKNFVLWNEIDYENMAETPVYFLNRKTKKKKTYIFDLNECMNLSLSPDGKYFTKDCGTYTVRDVSFYLAGSGAEIQKTSHDGNLNWSGDSSLNFNAVVWYPDGTCYASKSAVFKDGKITYGKKRIFSGGCEKVFTVNVSELSIYDSPGGKGKVIGTKKNDDIVEIPHTESSAGPWVNIYYDNKKAYVNKKDLKPVQ